jgi:3-deoxy-D-manno-octulosonate 8-phosphate phosphatase (KDO 8-P phosphatase)
METAHLTAKARRVKLVLTNSAGILTDNGSHHSDQNEAMQQFVLRDGVGVERLRNHGIATGLITAETAPAVAQRAHKLGIGEVHLGVPDKANCLRALLARLALQPSEVAFIGADTPDVALMRLVGLAACPADATGLARRVAHYRCTTPGGYGCFRELADFIITSQAPDPTGRQRLFFERQQLRSSR